jgi:Leucine-rich repeat (LRR) protein
MNRRVVLLVIGSLLLSLGCGDSLTGPSEFCGDQPDAAIATFEDANLEAAIRAALSVGSQEDLTCGLLSELTELPAWRREITSLAGIQNLAGLTNLWLDHNSITDVGPLQRPEWAHGPDEPQPFTQLDRRDRRAERTHGPDRAWPRQ